MGSLDFGISLFDPNMTYDAISIDTSIFEDQNFEFDSGLVNLLKQFKDKDVEFIFPETVHYEIRQRLIDKLISDEQNGSHGSNAYLASPRNDFNRPKTAVSHVFGHNYVEKRADEILEDFYADTSAVIISSSPVNTHDAVDLCFGRHRHNSDRASGTWDLSDAVSLLALNKWTIDNK